MTDVTRRNVLAGTVAATAATALTPFVGGTAKSAAPPVAKQVPGYYRYKLGNFEVTVVTDGVNRFKFPDGFVTNKNRDEVNAGLAAVHMEPDMMAVPYSPIVVNTGDKLVVIDTGLGEANFERSKGANGQFHSNLAAAGIDRNAVDVVVISHFHPDHVNGLLMANNEPGFPKAEILVPAAEWKFWTDDGEMSRAPQGRMADLFKNSRRVFDALGRKVTPYEPNKEIVTGITPVATNGHTPGHSSHIIASGNAKVYVQADVTNVPFLFARNPGWYIVFDQDPQAAEATRRKVYDMLAAEKMLVQGFHYPFPGLAHVEKSGSGYREIPVPWNPTI
jgi:glyoxylase-like metal-dependent hydrolase (beta-lactamase superfamily II)